MGSNIIQVPVLNRSAVRSVLGDFMLYDTYALAPTKFPDSQSGANDPDYKVKIARGIDAGHSYQRRSYVNFKRTPLRATGRWDTVDGWGQPVTYNNDLYSLFFDDFFIEVPYDSTLNVAALQVLKNKLASESKQLASLVPAAELREMGGLVRSMANLATQAVGEIARARKNPRDAFKRASEAWLTYSFGVSPLVATAKDVGESLASYASGVRRTKRQLGKSPTKTWTTSHIVYTGGPFGGRYRIDYAIEHRLRYLYGASTEFLVQGSNSYGAIEHFGLGAGTLPLVGWELLPYSWMFDYFSNIGDFLEDVFLAKSYSTKYVWENREYVANVQGIMYPESTSGARFTTITPGQCRYTFYSFERISHINLPRTPLSFKYRDTVASHAANKLLNLLSVFAGRKL